jgi:hypothetical protein
MWSSKLDQTGPVAPRLCLARRTPRPGHPDGPVGWVRFYPTVWPVS